jgi:ABC-type transport system involved in cytochrome bd biosynthesis fused ATPase/permease subunit
MFENLLSFRSPSVAAVSFNDPVLLEALRISGIALVAIFFVMGLFGVMIRLFSILFPATEDEAS